MKIINVPEGQSEESFRKCKILNAKRVLEVYKCISDDKEYFDNDTMLSLSMLHVQLQWLIEKFEGTRQ